MNVVKGNLHLTNWKRRQGCRCAGLRKIVDWCGCSPLAFRSSDISKYAIEVLHCHGSIFMILFDMSENFLIELLEFEFFKVIIRCRRLKIEWYFLVANSIQ